MGLGTSFVGDAGTNIVLTYKDQDGVVVNISTATTQQIVLKKPDGTKLTKTTIFVTDGTDGKAKYVVVAGDFSEEGVWKLQGKVILTTGTWYSDIHLFIIKTVL